MAKRMNPKTMASPVAGLKSSYQWIKDERIKCVVLDPDGWDRKNYEESMNEWISRDEFFHRMDASTCNHRYRDEDKYCSCMMARPALIDLQAKWQDEFYSLPGNGPINQGDSRE